MAGGSPPPPKVVMLFSSSRNVVDYFCSETTKASSVFSSFPLMIPIHPISIAGRHIFTPELVPSVHSSIPSDAQSAINLNWSPQRSTSTLRPPLQLGSIGIGEAEPVENQIETFALKLFLKKKRNNVLDVMNGGNAGFIFVACCSFFIPCVWLAYSLCEFLCECVYV